MKNFLISILNFFAGLILSRFKPTIIGITGSVGKTSTKEAIFQVLKNHFKTRANINSYNNELGLPLTVINAQAPGRNLLNWLLLYLKAIMVWVASGYPKILVLEMGADRTGDISKLLAVTKKVDIAVVTDIGVSHLANYPSMQALISEKLSLLKALPKDGTAVLNLDNQHVREALPKISQNKITYGFQDGDLVASDMQILRQGDSVGVNFKVHNKGTVVPFYIPGCLGQPPVYASLAAAGVGLALGLNLVNISEAMRGYVGPAGRLRYIPGIKRTWIIDDTYNAAPSSTIAAINALNQVATGRKVVVMGDMAELGKESDEGHKQVAVKIQESGASVAVTVGDSARIIFDELNNRKFSGKTLWFKTSDEARITVQNEIMEGDTVLIKGSQAVRMEKIVKEIMADPMDAEKLLVRQTGKWLAS